MAMLYQWIWPYLHFCNLSPDVFRTNSRYLAHSKKLIERGVGGLMVLLCQIDFYQNIAKKRNVHKSYKDTL